MKKTQPKKGQLHKTLSHRHRRRIPEILPPVENASPISASIREDDQSSRSGLWPIAAALLGTVLLIAAVVALPLSRRSNGEPATTDRSNTVFPQDIPTPPVARALNGGFVDSEANIQAQLVAISIDNALDARPSSGIDEALWVFEFPTESTITRFLAVYDVLQNVPQIGPVRSIRPFMIDFAQSLGAVPVHSGGSPDALKELSNNTPHRVSINEFSQTPYFSRDADRQSPHNLYTALERLRLHPLVQRLTPTLQSLVWKEQANSEEGSTILTIGYSEPYTVRWAYNPATHQMDRHEKNGEVQRTRAGKPIISDTVVIQFTDTKILDAIGRRSIRTLGEGDAMVVANGTMELARWVRKLPNDRTTLVDITGSPLPLNPGKIWWTVVSKGTPVTFE